MVAFAAALVSCKKESFKDNNSDGKVLMTVTASAVDTKTFVSTEDGVTYTPSWSKGDAIHVLEFIDGVLSQEANSSALDANSQEASFSVPLEPKDAGNFKYYAVYPKESYGVGTGENKFYRLQLPENQTFTADSFGAGADLLISGPMAAGLETQPSELNLKFKRIGSAARITVNGMTVGEKIASVKISTTEGYISGYSKYDPTTGVWEGTYAASTKSISLTPSPDQTYVTDGSDDIWVRLYPITISENLSIEITTDKAIYSKTINPSVSGRTIEFADGGLTTFSVSGLERVAKSTTGYVKVTSTADLYDGAQVLFVYTDVDVTKAAGSVRTGTGTQTYLSAEDAEITEDILTSTNAFPFILEKSDGNWKFKASDNSGYLYSNSAKLYIASSSQYKMNWKISIADDALATVTSLQDNNNLQYNTSDPRFKTYSSAQKKIYLYILDDGKEKPTLTATAGNIAVGKTLDLATLLSSNSDGAYTYALASAPAEPTCTLTGSSFTAETVGNYTISVTQAATDTYKQASVNVDVTVVDRNWELVSIAIITPPSKTTYDVGECFNPEGMVVQATYAATDDAEYTKKVDETSKISYPVDAIQAGTTSVDISFGGKSVSQAITVTEFEWLLMQIAVTTPPAKTEYKDGESFDPTGMVVTAIYSEVNDKAEDKTEDVTSRCTFSPNPLTLETTAVTISFGEETTTQSVTVGPNSTTLTENFTNSSATNDTYGCNTSLSSTLTCDYKWTSKGSGTVFKNGIKLGSKSAPGSVSNSTMLNGISVGTKVTVKVYAAVWNTDGGKISFTYNSTSSTKEASNSKITTTSGTYSADDFTTSTDFEITIVSGQTQFTVGSSSKRIIIDKIEVVY